MTSIKQLLTPNPSKTSADNVIVGSDSSESLLGGDGNDIIYGEGGNDDISGDIIPTEGGDDVLLGGSGNDTVRGYAGNDLILGGEGNDYLYGNLGLDVLMGKPGDDTIYGGKDSDYLIGGQGNEFLFGDFGSDVMTGGSGNDVFALRVNAGDIDLITDFKKGADRIGLVGSAFTSKDILITQATDRENLPQIGNLSLSDVVNDKDVLIRLKTPEGNLGAIIAVVSAPGNKELMATDLDPADFLYSSDPSSFPPSVLPL